MEKFFDMRNNNNGFYFGHSFKWMRQVKKTFPKYQRLKRKNIHCLAECLLHQYKCSKGIAFELNHKILEEFSLDRRYIKPYLKILQQNKFIKYEIKKGKPPLITLLFSPKKS